MGPTTVYDIIVKRRSIRRYKQNAVPFDTLIKFVDAGRLAPSASNLQPLEYLIVDQHNLLNGVYSALKWAGYIAPDGDPPEGERPTAYIVMLVRKDCHAGEYPRDVGAAVENILLSAREEGIGSCWIRSFDRKKLMEVLNIPTEIEIDSVIALGYINEDPVLEEMMDSVKYWKDDSGRLHVPKRRMKEILHHNRYR